MDVKQLAGCIDHTLLDATATEEKIEQLCREARSYGFHTVCVNPRWVALAAEQLAGSKVAVGGVVSLPLGADSTTYLQSQIQAVLKVCRSMRPAVVLKVIIESAALSREQKIFACQIADRCRVDFIKTSTGLHPAGGATIEDIKLMKETAPGCKIKAAGGIKTAKQALEMLEAGAERIGTSSGVQIINELRAEQAK